jgi:hypothetical protein
MTLTNSHASDNGAAQSILSLPKLFLRWVRAASTASCKARLGAGLRRLRSEMLFSKDYDGMFNYEHDAKDFPQLPMFLDSKWDM